MSFSVLVSFTCFSSSALTVNSTYSDVTSTSTQAVNLVNFAMSYEDFVTSDYVVFCNEQNSYYIVWGDLSYNDSSVSGSDVQYLRYYRAGSGTSYQYTYQYGTDSSFKLTPSHMCTSNIKTLVLVLQPIRTISSSITVVVLWSLLARCYLLFSFLI